jgi:hypothetical protein
MPAARLSSHCQKIVREKLVASCDQKPFADAPMTEQASLISTVINRLHMI